MLTLWMLIHVQLTAMALNESSKAKGKATDRAIMPTSVINGRLFLDCDHIQGFLSEHVHQVLRIYKVCIVKDQMAWDLVCDVIILDPVTSRHFLELQPMWLHFKSRCLSFRVWWAAFRSEMRQMCDNSHDQMTYCRSDNPRA